MKPLQQSAVQFLSFCFFIPLVGLVHADSPCPKLFGHSFAELKSKFNSTSSDTQYDREVLLSEITIKFQQNGTCEETKREIWMSRLKSTGDQGTLEVPYSPWYQNKPTIQAKVYDRNGKVYELTEDDSTVAPAQGDDRTVLSDKLIVRAVLPGLQENGIVEQTTTISERTPFFRSGSLRSFVIDAFDPTQYLSIQVEAPQDLAINIGFVGNAVPVQESVADGTRRWRIELSPPKLIEVNTIERYAPIDVAQISSLTISTGKSWKAVAQEYSDLVDQRLMGVDFVELVKELNIPSGISKRQQVEVCKKWIQNNIRYTSISLGDASIVPTRPMQTLTRRFGDCKDQSTLLVGMLRHLGIEANVALVNSWSYRLPNASFPALNGFDHAIARASADGEDLWIDCTFLGSGPESMPIYLQGKKALIASSQAEQLTKIPMRTKSQNTQLESRNVTIEAQQCEFQTDEVHSGFYAASIKNFYLSNDKAESEIQANKQLAQTAPNAKFTVLSLDDPWDESAMFRRTTRTTGLELVAVNNSKSRLDLTIAKLFEDLPEAYLMRSQTNTKIDRKAPAELLVPFTRQRITTVVASKGQTLMCKPGEQKETIGCVSILRRTTQESPDKIVVDMKLEADNGLLTVQELEKLSEITSKLEDPTNPWNAAIYTTVPDVVPQEISVASIQAAKKTWEQDQTDVALEKYIEELLACSMVDEARTIAEDATKRFPDSAWSHCALGWTWIVDPIGREFFPGMNQSKAKEEFRRALAIDPGHMRSSHFLTYCLIRDETGLIYDDKTLNQQCIEVVENAVKQSGATVEMLNNLVLCYIRNGQFEEAFDQLNKQGNEHLALGLRCYENALNGRWKEIEETCEKRQSDLDSLEIALDYARRCLSDQRRYKDAARMVNLLVKAGVKNASSIVKGLNALQMMDVPKNPTASPANVVTELVLRLATDGILPHEWGDIIINPESYDKDFELLASILFSNRITIRQGGVNRRRVLDLIPPQVRATGNEENGFQCVAQIGSRFASVAVLKFNGEFKILLSGENKERLIEHAQECAGRGKMDDAYKWIEFLMQSLPDMNPLSAESGSPAKAIWKSNKNKSPELFDRCIKMLKCTSPPDVTLKQFEEWIAKEKSASKKLQYQRCLLEQLAATAPADYLREVAPFLEKNPSFYGEMYRTFLTLMERGEFDKGQEFLDKWKDSLPEEFAAMIDAKLPMYREDYDSALKKLQASSKLFNNTNLWNSYFWASLFVGNIDSKEVAGVQELLRKGSLADLHTLACAEADAGMLVAAVSDLKLLNSLQNNRMDDSDWLIVGLIAQKCQLNDAAKVAYARVKPDTKRFSSYDLAQKRLKSIAQEK